MRNWLSVLRRSAIRRRRTWAGMTWMEVTPPRLPSRRDPFPPLRPSPARRSLQDQLWCHRL